MSLTTFIQISSKIYLIFFLFTNWTLGQQKYTSIQYDVTNNGELVTSYTDDNATALYLTSSGPNYLSKNSVFKGKLKSTDVITILQNDTVYLQGSLLKEGDFIWHKDSISHKNTILNKKNQKRFWATTVTFITHP